MTTAHVGGFSRCCRPILLLRDVIPPAGVFAVKMPNDAWPRSPHNFYEFRDDTEIPVVEVFEDDWL
jgi:hypothetical protein